MKILNLTALITGLFLFGCRHNVSTNINSQAQAQVDAHADVTLTEAASSITHSLHQLAEIEQAANPPKYHIPSPDPASYGMETLTSIDWNGPIEPLVERIAMASHYKLRVLGKEPAIPIIISINKKDTPMADLLKDAGLQAGKTAEIVVFPSFRTLELRYANV